MLWQKAVCELYLGTKIATDPAIENGFYYDFKILVNLTPEDYSKVEAKMRKVLLRKELLGWNIGLNYPPVHPTS